MDRVRRYEEKFAKAVRDYEPHGAWEYASLLRPLVGAKRLEEIVAEVRPKSDGLSRRYR